MTNEELALRAQAGDLDARNQLWEAVRRMCYKLAHRFFPLCQRAGIERADLEQELFFGFLAALDMFHPRTRDTYSPLTWTMPYATPVRTRWASETVKASILPLACKHLSVRTSTSCKTSSQTQRAGSPSRTQKIVCSTSNFTLHWIPVWMRWMTDGARRSAPDSMTV